MKPIITVEGVSKRYTIGKKESYGSLRDEVMDALSSPFRRVFRGGPATEDPSVWALRDVSFDVHQGDVLAIIGRNGAGKSTLLKILSRITEPTEGRIEMRGRIASLLEVGTGFHPELTGRENIFMNGALLGMSSREIRAKFDEIVAFSEIEKFLDTPVKRYSSGMYVRLAFAVAAHLEPEILVIDEVLAVGDAAFQKKCLGKMGEVSKGGRTVLFVSHNMAAVENLCTKAILLQNGALLQRGTPNEIILKYISSSSQNNGDLLNSTVVRSGSGDARISKISYGNILGEKKDVRCGDSLEINIEYKIFRNLNAPVLRFTIYNSIGMAMSHFDSEIYGVQIAYNIGCHQLTCRMKEMNFAPDNYYLNVGITDVHGTVDYALNVCNFSVLESDYIGTGKLPPSKVGAIVQRYKCQITSLQEGK